MSQAYASGARHAFSSKSAREINSAILKKRFVPGVGTYEITQEDIDQRIINDDDENLTSVFYQKANKAKQRVNLYDPHAPIPKHEKPGPGYYFRPKGDLNPNREVLSANYIEEISESSDSEYPT